MIDLMAHGRDSKIFAILYMSQDHSRNSPGFMKIQRKKKETSYRVPVEYLKRP